MKETPQERLKRIMQAQLNRQAQKDNVVAAQKKMQVGSVSSPALPKALPCVSCCRPGPARRWVWVWIWVWACCNAAPLGHVRQ